MPILNIKVKNKVAEGDNQKIICGNSDYTVNFTFDEEWANYNTKTLRVIHGITFTDVVFTGSTAILPVIQNVLGVQIGVFAGNLHTTTPAYYDTVKSILCGGGTPAPPTADVYSQIISELNNKAEKNQGTENAGKYWKVGQNGELIFVEGGNDKNFVFEQRTPSTSWSITHNLGKYPSVEIVDSGNSVVIGDIKYNDLNTLTVSFTASFSGKAYLN